MPGFLKNIYRKAVERVPEQASQEELDSHLTDALGGNDYALIEDLVRKGASVHVKDILAETPLHKAAFANKTRLAEMLIEKGAKVNSLAIDGTTPLHKAALKRSPQFFSWPGRTPW